MFDLLKSLDKEKVLSFVFPSVNNDVERNSISVYFEIPHHRASETKNGFSDYIGEIEPTLVNVVKRYIPDFKYLTAHFAEIQLKEGKYIENIDSCYIIADENYNNVIAAVFSFSYDNERFPENNGGIVMEVLKVF